MAMTKYPEGSDLTILNTIYQKPKKDDETGKWSKDNITVIFKDNVSGKKGHVFFENPDYHYYKVKPNIPADYCKLYTPLSEVDECIAPYQDIKKDIAARTDNLDFYYDNLKCGNGKGNDALHLIPSIFGSDRFDFF